MSRLYDEMIARRDPAQVAGLSRFFKTGPGQYGEGDRFLGIKVPVTREVVKEVWRETGFDDLEECISSEYHEVRLAALLTLVQIFKHAKKDVALQQKCVDFYLSHTLYINNWDLVDLSCYEILGAWLLDKDRGLLYDLARNGKTIWEQRIGIVSTMAFVRKGQVDDIYAISEIFLDKPQPLHDLLQKAVGWMLREAGKREDEGRSSVIGDGGNGGEGSGRDCDDGNGGGPGDCGSGGGEGSGDCGYGGDGRLLKWLRNNKTRMPRTMLRYAIEKFPPEIRKELLDK